jgi:hypothetical protein
MWMRELDNFETEYAKYKNQREAIQSPTTSNAKAAAKTGTVIKRVVKKPAAAGK